MHLFLKTTLLSSAFLVGAAVGVDLTPKVASASSRVVVSAQSSSERMLSLRVVTERGVRNLTARVAANQCAQLEEVCGGTDFGLEVCQDDGPTLRVKVMEWDSSKEETHKRRLNFSFNIDSETRVTVASWQAAEGGSVTVSASVQ